jgi:hypothetical protein
MSAAARPPGEDEAKRILLVAPNLSRHMGGEALKALQIHLELRALGYRVRQIAHARVRNEMSRDHPELDIVYVEDDWLQSSLYRAGILPALGLLNAWQLHRLAVRTARSFGPWVVHFTHPSTGVPRPRAAQQGARGPDPSADAAGAWRAVPGQARGLHPGRGW